MSMDFAANVLAGLIFVGVLCYGYKAKFGNWPWQD